MINMKRANGVLLHISSLPSDYGIGSLGKEAYEFVDFLVESKQTYWQILPIGPTGYGDSPYSSFSTFAGNPYFVSLDILCEEGYLTKDEYIDICWQDVEDKVDYGLLYEKRFPLLQIAMRRFLSAESHDFNVFCEANDWLDDYAAFMTIKDVQGGKHWVKWPDALKLKDDNAVKEVILDNYDTYNFYRAIQYHFFKQWHSLKEYTKCKGIEIIGDLPIYMAYDSVDVWAHRELFELASDGNPVRVAGCPPDGFSATGQLWGNPLYRWDENYKQGFSWWLKRITYLANVYDVVRIDHFRGFASFYAINYGESDACNGMWCKGPGMDLFKLLPSDLKIIAEDLGFLSEDVFKLLEDSGYPGMKVLEFAFDTREPSHVDYLPFNYPKHSIAYCGTHDNSTIMGWLKAANSEDVKLAKEYMMAEDESDFNWVMMKTLMATSANVTILQVQDLLGLDDSARMNTPATSENNWVWRCKKGSLNHELADKLAYYTKLYYRD